MLNRGFIIQTQLLFLSTGYSWCCHRVGMHGDWEETARTGDPNWPKGYSRSHPQYIKWGEKEKGGTFGGMVFVFPSHHHVSCGPALLEMAEHLPACGEQSINALCGFVCVCEFCFPTKLPVSQPMREFSSLSPPDSLPSPAGGAVSKQLPGATCASSWATAHFPTCRLTKLRAT